MLRQAIQGIQKSKSAIPLIILVACLANSTTTIIQAWLPESYPDYSELIIPSVQKCNPLHYPITESVTLGPNDTVIDLHQTHPSRDPLKWWLNCFSYKTFGTPNLVPIFFNLGLMPLVYLLTVKLTNNKLIGLFSFIAFVSNPLYNNWMTSGTYDQVWSFFLILSIYLMYKFKKIGTISAIFSFITSLTAKALGVMYLPSILYSYWKTENSPKMKLLLLLSTLVICVSLAELFMNKTSFIFGGTLGFHPENLSIAASRDFEMLFPELPFLGTFFLIAFYFKPKESLQAKKTSAIWILNALLTTPIIFLFTNQFQFVYRFVPLAVFMSIFIGITIVEAGKFIIEAKLRRKSK